MRKLCCLALTLAFVPAPVRAEEKAKQAAEDRPAIARRQEVLRPGQARPAKGPVLVRLTCACSGCDQELAYFQKLQAAYNAKGLQTIAVFREKPEAVESYAVKKDIKFMWLSDPKGDLWKTFDTKAMPTNILIDKGGKVVKMVPGCTKDGKNAQTLSAEIAKLLQTDEASRRSSSKCREEMASKAQLGEWRVELHAAVPGRCRIFRIASHQRPDAVPCSSLPARHSRLTKHVLARLARTQHPCLQSALCPAGARAGTPRGKRKP